MKPPNNFDQTHCLDFIGYQPMALSLHTLHLMGSRAEARSLG